MYADRIKNLPPYLFARSIRAKQEARARGVDVIDLSVGDPDLPTLRTSLRHEAGGKNTFKSSVSLP